MKAFLGAVNDLLWAAFLDDNEWWILAHTRDLPPVTNPKRG